MLYQEGHTLAKADYLQSAADTPELDVENGRFSEVHEEMKGAASTDSRNGSGSGTWLKKFKLMTHSCTQIHSCVKTMIVD